MSRARGAGLLPRLGGRRPATRRPLPFVPPDPASLSQPLEPILGAIRARLIAHRRRLWLRRATRQAWIAVLVIAVAEAAIAVAQRLWPIEAALAVALAMPVLVTLALLVAVALSRPTLGETALAVDAEGRTGDAVASALSFAAAPGPQATEAIEAFAPDDAAARNLRAPVDDAHVRARFIVRQRRDALDRLTLVNPGLFRPRFARRRAAGIALAALVAVPALLLPNPQDAVIAQNRAIREEAQAQAQQIAKAADKLASKGATPTDPRTKLAEELRKLAEQLRQNPGDLQANLAQLGAVEDDARSQLDPTNEQRASALVSVARALSQAATGNPQANPEGNTKITHEDLNSLGAKLDTMTPDQRAKMSVALSALQQQVTQADATAGQALQAAASSMAQGDTAAAKAALDKLGQALEDANGRVQQNRDLAEAASKLQDARKNLADAGDPGKQTAQQGAQGQAGQQGSNRGSGQMPASSPGASGSTGQGQNGAGGPGASGSASGPPGSGGPAASGSGAGPGGSPGASGGGQGQGQVGSPGPSGAGQGQGQGQNPGQGSSSGQQGQGGSPGFGGGGTNAAFLGSGIRTGSASAPTGPNRASTLGQDLSSVYAPFDRLGKPGDPSYVAGTGGDGQLQQGNQGQGTNNGAAVPYQQVYSDFYQYAQTTLDRSYVPTSVKDYVRDYFSSLDPKQ